MILSQSFLNKFILVLLTLFISLAGCRSVSEPVPAGMRISDAAPALGPIAVLPVYNLSGNRAPLKAIHQLMLTGLNQHGFETLDSAVLDQFMARQRMRNTGGLNAKLSAAFRANLGIRAVMITSLELYNDRWPLKAALNARLVSTTPLPAILWMDGTGLAGDDTPGLLGLSLIKNPENILKQAAGRLSASLANHLTAETKGAATPLKRKKYRPGAFYRSPIISSGMKYKVAVVPFFDASDRKYAGEIMALHFVAQLRPLKNIEVIEPGIVRQALLETRVVMTDGLSLADADPLFIRLDADLILTGRVLEYQDYQGADGKPIVDFSSELFERKSREIVWKVQSHHRGDDGVFFFNLGKINTAHLLATEMVRSAVGMIFQ